jgi:hypothetical protein
LCLGWSGAVHGFRQASGDILGNARNFIGKPCYILLVNIGLLLSLALEFLLFVGFYGWFYCAGCTWCQGKLILSCQNVSLLLTNKRHFQKPQTMIIL